MTRIMGILNITPDSFWAPSRTAVADLPDRIGEMLRDGAEIIDIGAVSTRPGAGAVGFEEEWHRLHPALEAIASMPRNFTLSIDTTSSEIVRRSYGMLGNFIVNDISAGEDDSEMLETAGSLGLEYIAMHKRGNPRTMDSMTVYDDIIAELLRYFEEFGQKARAHGIRKWILDPGLGFAKTSAQSMEILERLAELKKIGRPILIGAADKRFTAGDTAGCHRLALRNGADILRVHDVKAAAADIGSVNAVEK